MASCQTSQWVNTAPYVKLTVTEKTSTSNISTLQWTLQYIASHAANTSVNKEYSVTIAGSVIKSGTFNIDGKTGTHTIASGTKTIAKTKTTLSIAFGCSFGFNLTWSDVYKGTLSASGTYTVAAKTQYAVSYDANGGSGAPSAQLKWYGEKLTISSATPSRTGYTFQGWSTSKNGSVAYSPGDTYTANAGLLLYAVWKANTYAVTYNANGGEGAPANQTKTHDKNLQISSIKPTRENYTFAGWATSATSTTVAYKPGAYYTANAALSLYAVWVLAYTKPRITNIKMQRCDLEEGGLDYIVTGNDSGANVELSFDVEADFAYPSIEVLCKVASVSGWDSAITPTESSSGVGAGGKTMSYTAYFKNLSAENSYTLRITARDTGGETVIIRTIPAAFFSIDFKPPTETSKGGAAIGKPAELDGVFDVGFETLLRGGIRPLVLEPNTDLNDVQTPNTYIGANIASNFYANCPLKTGTFTLTVEAAGEEGQRKQILTRCSKTEPERYFRFFYQNEWGAWKPDAAAVIYEQATGIDLNNYVDTGVWYFNSSHTPLNLPSGNVNGWLVVLRADSGAIKQFWLRYGTLNTNDFSTYVRTSNGTTWSAWRQFAENPVLLFEGSEAGNVTLSETVANFNHIEIIYTDNNGKNGGVAKIYDPMGKAFCASLIEASAATTTFIRSTAYTAAANLLIPNVTTAGYIKISEATISRSTGVNYIRIVKVLGYRA